MNKLPQARDRSILILENGKSKCKQMKPSLYHIIAFVIYLRDFLLKYVQRRTPKQFLYEALSCPQPEETVARSRPLAQIRRVGGNLFCMFDPSLGTRSCAAAGGALRCCSYALTEATCNQVNQAGGYTGMRPAKFFESVHRLAAHVGLPAERVLLGGDHLGPNCWKSSPYIDAMHRSALLVRDYIEPGFRKIHLDCSMSCADDPPALDDEVIAARAAELCEVAEQASRRSGAVAQWRSGAVAHSSRSISLGDLFDYIERFYNRQHSHAYVNCLAPTEYEETIEKP